MNAQITAIINQKGGVGKTTSTVNLGVGLAREGKKVLLVDADPQGSLSISMGLQNPDELSDTLSTLMLAEMEYRPIYPDHGIIHHKEGVDLLPGNIELSGVELSLFNTMSRELVLRNVLDRLRCNYDYILIDCMPSLGLMNINALAAADSVIIPLQPHFLSTKGLNLLLRSVARVRRQINPKLRIDGILFTMVDSRTNNSQSIMSSLRSTVGDSIRVFNTEIPRSVRAVEAAEQGKCYKLKIIVKRPGSVKQIPASLREDIVKLDRRIEETRFLGKHQIETAADLSSRKQYAQTQIQVLTDQRQELRNTLKRVTRLGDTEAIAETKAQISALTGELKQYRREVKLCDSVAERSGLIKENLNAIIEQEKSDRREKNEHEHSRRRGGTNRQDVSQWR